MAKIIVQKVKEEGKTNKGTTFWMCLGTIDGELDEFKVWDAPQLGLEFEGEVKDNGKYGKAISTESGGSRGSGRRSYERDPEVGRQIMRQNALDHSTQILMKVADLTFQANPDKTKGLDEAKKLLKADKVVNLADLFFHYSAGTLTRAASTQVATPPPVSQQTKDAVTQAFPETADQIGKNNPVMPGDIDPNDLPF